MLWFTVLWIVLFAVAILLMVKRQLRNRPLKSEILNDPVSYWTRALVRRRATGRGGAGWATFKGSTQLIVRSHSVEVSMTSSLGNLLAPGSYLRSWGATMWIDETGWLGSSIGQRQCIRLSGEDANGKVDLAVAPYGSMDDAWQALLGAGVSPIDRPS